MIQPQLFSKHIYGNCRFIHNLAKGRNVKVANVKSYYGLRVVFNNNLNNLSFSSLVKSQEKLIFTNQRALTQVRKFSFQETFDSAIITHSALFRSITESTTVDYAKNFLIQFHDYFGLPWWLSIIFTTCIVRGLVTFPIALYQVSEFFL